MLGIMAFLREILWSVIDFIHKPALFLLDADSLLDAIIATFCYILLLFIFIRFILSKLFIMVILVDNTKTTPEIADADQEVSMQFTIVGNDVDDAEESL
ncbi:hypothetical protein VKT23_019422 [Stygiomarasmius scandens]|uniref:Uncharacterized protein n=1 Tax=Marasmiellus scandens TaxID=2682957 RepID=A0ABR1IQG2_9AGAR